jgi:hypothetical protein
MATQIAIDLKGGEKTIIGIFPGVVDRFRLRSNHIETKHP